MYLKWVFTMRIESVAIQFSAKTKKRKKVQASGRKPTGESKTARIIQTLQTDVVTSRKALTVVSARLRGLGVDPRKISGEA